MDSIWSQERWIPAATFSISQYNQPPQLQLQQQSHAMIPRASKQSEARKYTAKDWDALRPEITQLYMENTLDRVMQVMRLQHGLSAT